MPPLLLTVLFPLVVVWVVAFVTLTVLMLLTVVACVAVDDAMFVEHGPVSLTLAPALGVPTGGVVLVLPPPDPEEEPFPVFPWS